MQLHTFFHPYPVVIGHCLNHLRKHLSGISSLEKLGYPSPGAVLSASFSASNAS